MEVLWNQINLQRPPFRSWDISVNNFDHKKFSHVIDEILTDFKTFEILHTEAALLSRLIYRMKSKFRSDKGLKHMEKVNRALLNYLKISLPSEYKQLKIYTEVDDEVVSLPSRQILEYILIRTQGFAKLMCRVESMAMIAGTFLKSRLHIGQSWAIALIAYSVISRIWILARSIIKKSCVWYDKIYHYFKIFKTVGVSWLPDNYRLPQSLSEWLNLPWFDEDLEKVSIREHWDNSIFNLIKVNKSATNATTFDELVSEFKNETKSYVQLNLETQQNKLVPKLKKEDDLGQAISRDDFKEVNDNLTEVITNKLNKKKKDINGNPAKKNYVTSHVTNCINDEPTEKVENILKRKKKDINGNPAKKIHVIDQTTNIIYNKPKEKVLNKKKKKEKDLNGNPAKIKYVIDQTTGCVYNKPAEKVSNKLKRKKKDLNRNSAKINLVIDQTTGCVHNKSTEKITNKLKRKKKDLNGNPVKKKSHNKFCD